MRKLWSLLVRALTMLILFLWSAILVSMLIDWWYRRSVPAPKPKNEMPPAANISAPTGEARTESAPSFATDASQSDSGQSPSKDDVGTTSAQTSTAGVSGDGVWTRKEIVTLRDTLDNDAMVTLMQMLRDRGGEPVNFNEIEEATGRNMSQTRADLSMLSRKSHLINGHTSWPLDTATPTDGVSNTAYSMPRQYLEWWFGE